MRIGITQRVLERPDRGETWDCIDQRLVVLVQSMGNVPVLLSNAIESVPEYIKDINVGGIMLSGGNDLSTVPGGTDTSTLRDRFETTLLDYFSKHKLPVFGICRGLQMLNCYFGGTLIADCSHVAKPHEVAPTAYAPTQWIRPFIVNSFHSWTIPPAALGPHLVPLAVATDETIEAARHSTLPIAGVMWHPEREDPVTQHDLSLIKDLFGGTQ